LLYGVEVEHLRYPLGAVSPGATHPAASGVYGFSDICFNGNADLAAEIVVPLLRWRRGALREAGC